jgi:hypothetical protein
MKKLILLFFLILPITVFSQSKFAGFFKPVQDNIFEQPRSMGAMTIDPNSKGIWLFRPAVEVSALQLVYNKDTKQLDASSFQSGGLGMSYSHFINNNGTPYQDFAVNGLVLFDATPGKSVNASLSGAVTVTVMQYLNVGAGYNFGVKTWFILSGITYNFN